jgi:hypothetical protein
MAFPELAVSTRVGSTRLGAGLGDGGSLRRRVGGGLGPRWVNRAFPELAVSTRVGSTRPEAGLGLRPG